MINKLKCQITLDDSITLRTRQLKYHLRKCYCTCYECSI